MTAAPPRTADDLCYADRLRLEAWMAAWLVTEDEARRELGLPVAPREIGKHNASSSQARHGMPFYKPF